MLRQYQEAKAQAGDALLFFRLGDFFELFYDDARIAAQLLGITLTSRAKGEDRVPMAGVPHHAAKGYVAKLVAAGHKVAICDQVEVPGPGKKLVRREIVRLVTPGTLVDEEALQSREPIWLAALALEEDRAALALLDASTGELRALPPGRFAAMLDELQRARPREVLLPEQSALAEQVRKASGAVHVELRAFRDAFAAEQLLKRHLGVATLDGFGLRDPLLIQAAAEALGYLQETQRSAAQHVVRVQVEQPSRFLFIDPSAAQNLELFRGPDGRRNLTLLSVVDRTLTAAGGRMLARWLSAPLLDLEAIGARQDAVEELSQAAVAREELGEHLRGVLDMERLLGRLAMGQGAPRDLGGLRGSLQQMPRLAAALEQRSAPLLKSLAPPLRQLADLAALLDRALLDEVPPGRDPGFVRPGFRPELDELAELAQGGRAAIAAMETAERARTGVQSLKVRYNKIFGFYIEVTKPNLHLVPSDYQRKSSTVGTERFVTPALAEHEARVLSAEERRAAVEQQIFEELRLAVLARSAELRVCAEAAAQADSLLSLARVAAEWGWTRPTVDHSQIIEIAAGRHPVVERALSSSSDGPFVPNDLLLDEQRRLVVLTGPNMAGKSTAMRQVALIAILAQSGSFVPAGRARIGLVDRLFTRVGAADDLARGQSTFMVEMAECARILHQATPRSLLLLDEVGRGTSTFDGLAIAWAVAEHIHDAIGARTLFATHYHELCDLTREKPRAVNLTMAVTEVEGRVVFLRKIVPGAASRSYGIHVARLAGLPERVLQRAREILENLEAKELDESGKPALSRKQLGLFEQKEHPLIEALRQLDLSRTTPLEALFWLDEAQKKLR
ncbi:MAG: DNA mismatch repair protein MutS [Deltaproteobacteria bacterium]|nr:MAG: DNA mismatch repair protein MutS [Deltaproteobacteria bacterium]